MSWLTELPSAFSSIVSIAAAMALVAGIEAAIPLHARSRWNRRHLAPNLALTAITLGTNLALGGLLLALLAWQEERGIGLLPALSLAGPLATAATLLALDFSFYVAHVAMHRLPAFWRFHRVHHADPAVDVTTTIRQHPGETLIRFAFTTAFACALGASPAAYAVYRSAVALNGLLEHANIRLPRRLDDALALVTTWPGFHKVHHARDAAFTDSNYGNLFSWWDRLFGTARPARLGERLATGLDGFDDGATQTTRGLLALPFRSEGARGTVAVTEIG